jgi:hypothetical protein
MVYVPTNARLRPQHGGPDQRQAPFYCLYDLPYP